jgi:hypothetical protein
MIMLEFMRNHWIKGIVRRQLAGVGFILAAVWGLLVFLPLGVFCVAMSGSPLLFLCIPLVCFLMLVAGVVGSYQIFGTWQPYLALSGWAGFISLLLSWLFIFCLLLLAGGSPKYIFGFTRSSLYYILEMLPGF